jgi:hypothetical protein
MKRKSIVKGGAMVVAVALAFGVYHRIVSAETTSSSIAYSGYLEDAGTPVNGSRDIGFNLWKSSSTTDVTNRVCQQLPEPTTVSAGWFTVPVAGDCLDALRRYPSLYMQFVVGSTTFPLQPIGAVPYAFRALEYESGARLRRKVRYATDGSKQVDTLTWWDSERGEECSFKTLPGGPSDSGLCLPSSTYGAYGCDGGGLFTDGGCLNPLTSVSGAVSSTPPAYVPSTTSSSGLALPSPGQVVFIECSWMPCQIYQGGLYYAAGSDVPAEAFVSWTESYE